MFRCVYLNLQQEVPVTGCGKIQIGVMQIRIYEHTHTHANTQKNLPISRDLPCTGSACSLL